MTKVYERIIPGYREVHKKRLAGKGPGSYDLAQPNPVEYRSFIGNVHHFAFFLDWFDELGISGPWETHLDLGGAEGNHASLSEHWGYRSIRKLSIFDLSRRPQGSPVFHSTTAFSFLPVLD